jgi:transcriptional regulator with PAS, ATPase and Fis domain
MSQPHARFVREGETWIVEDGGSRNGTRLNAAHVSRKSLNDGDTIECGGTFFVLRHASPFDDGEPLKGRPEALRTVSPAFGRDLSLLCKMARTLTPVLVLGETGTGKEGIAAAIHELSRRRGRFVALNCGAIPPTLIESELFGTRRGAFSGALNRKGLFLAANRGTLFLDEVGELPASSQAALLRVLQEREIVPLGSDESILLDVRVIAATNKPLAQLVASGAFRHDLYARLKCYEVYLPPLRERREDMGLLVATLVKRHDPSGAQRTLSREAARALFAYQWPLNIRELEQCISAALALAEREIGIAHIRQSIREVALRLPAAGSLDRDTIVATIRLHNGNMTAVARALAMSRTHLYRLLERYAITRADTDTPK